MTGCAGDTAAPPQAVMVILNRSGFGGDALADPSASSDLGAFPEERGVINDQHTAHRR